MVCFRMQILNAPEVNFALNMKLFLVVPSRGGYISQNLGDF